MQADFLPTELSEKPLNVAAAGGASGKKPTCQCIRDMQGDIRDAGSISGLGKSPGGGQGNHSSILAWKISQTRGAWQAPVHEVSKSWT